MAADINNHTIKALISTKLPRQAPLHSNLDFSTKTMLLSMVLAAVQAQTYSIWIPMTMECEPVSQKLHSAATNPSKLILKLGSTLSCITPASHHLLMPHL
jgi:hypothetical protein